MNIPRPRSLKGLLLLYETAFLLLVFGTAALAGLWTYFWQQSSRESVRLNVLLFETQQVRGDLYTLLKEVIRARLTEDDGFLLQYQSYLERIEQHFHKVQDRIIDDDEQLALNYMQQTYQAVRSDMDRLSTDPYLISEAARVKLLDPLYEEWMLAEFESALLIFNRIVETRRQALEQSLDYWTRAAPWVLAFAAALAALLPILSRRSLKHGFMIPMQALIEGGKRFSRGELAYRIIPQGVAEASHLARTFNLMAQDLSASRDALIAAEKQAVLGALVPVVAHNIRNPLASIRAAAQLLEDPADRAELKETSAAIIDTVDRLERWVSALLSYLHPLKPHPVPARLATIVDGALAPLKNKIDAKQLRIEKHGWDDIRCRALVDIDLLEQAIYGLLNNAVDAAPERSVIALCLRAVNFAELTIDDQGPGLPFDPRPGDLTPGPSTKRFGTGLGIPFAFKVCAAHGASLSFAPRLPKGTRVSLTFPPGPAP